MPTSGQPGWRYDPGSGHWDGDGPSWKFDPGAFARQYAAGDSPAQRAYASLHGSQPLQLVPGPELDGGGGTGGWKLGHRQPGDRLTAGELARVSLEVVRPNYSLDPSRITKLNHTEAVWFDPVHGFSTSLDNLKDGWMDKAVPVVLGAALSVVTAGAAGAAMGVTATSGVTIGQGMVMAAVGNTTMQLVGGRDFNFKQLLISTLSAGATTFISNASGLGQMLKSPDIATRLAGHAGRASLQGLLQQASGGKFITGFANSALASLGGEITAHLDAQIGAIEG
ncbi:hypothetical protein [Ottowia testudinis]|nr:hypothetical protein [Ottowia testudinis]QTD45633.1 hypothetical protein J1M35_01530 [Ottowia testudinis]QTD46035.1 hypothetical protein J1M35_03750 [Ottowia testudinis]